MDSYIHAEEMGIQLEREWLATLDNRTRHAHRILDGQRAPNDKPFTVDGHEIWFPGDSRAPGYLVYNCRCTLIADVLDVPKSPNPIRRARDPETGRSIIISDMTYVQWESWKKSENRYIWDTYQKMGKNASADQNLYMEYNAVLGNKASKSFWDFQSIKYRQPDNWEELKKLVREKRKENERK